MIIARFRRIARNILRKLVGQQFLDAVSQGRDAYNQTKAELLARKRDVKTGVSYRLW
jgi:hypothetical protein